MLDYPAMNTDSVSNLPVPRRYLYSNDDDAQIKKAN